MKNKKLTITIGIPAYNEEANIKNLLESLLAQKEENFILKRIVVISDGSTDRTNQEVAKIKNSKITLIKGKERIGQQARQNQFLKILKGDILVIIEADCLPENKDALNNLIYPFYKKEPFGLTVAYTNSVKAEGFFEKSVYHGYALNLEIFDKWKDGINVYTLGGHCAKAISKEFAKKLYWPDGAPEDSYTYFRAKDLGIRSQRINNSLFVKKNVSNPADRLKQSTKFMTGKRSLTNFFNKKLVESDYNISFWLIAEYSLIHLFKNPLWISMFIFNTAVNRLLTLNKKQFNHLYDVYTSTKNLGRFYEKS